MKGDVAPPPQHELVETTTRDFEKPCKPISKYAFADGKKNVKIYVDWPGIGAKAETVTCTFEKSGFDLRIVEGEATSRLFIPNLRNDIKPEMSSHRLKDDQIVITCAKDEETTWYELKKASPL